MGGWHNVSKSEPCPICQKPDWCNLSDDGAVCICHRVESPYPAKSGSGWIHALRANDERRMMNDERTTGNRQLTTAVDLARVHRAYDADPVLIEGLATTLGVDDEPLKAMDVRFNRFDECWSFPMRDAEGRVVGLRFRELGGSRKWSARGSHDGLFYAPSVNSDSSDATLTLRVGSGVQSQLQTHDGSNCCGCEVRSFGAVAGAPAVGVNSPNELIIVEGPSDTAALLSLFNQLPTTNHQLPTVVGRSSCQSGAPTLRQYIRRVRPRCITIVADNDEPGIRGADLLATQLKQSNNSNNQTMHPPMRVLIVPHPYKDVRAWYLSGKLTPRLFADMASAQKWR